MVKQLFKLCMVCLVGMSMLLLSACAGAVPWNKQNYAGVEEWSVEYVIADGESGLKRVHYINAKEASASEIKIALSDGTVLNFAGDGITAFQGQAIRADVENTVAEQMGDVSPEIVNSIIDAIVRPPD